MSDVHDASYYAKCMVGGIFACGLTHMAVCPLDIVKCRKQANPGMYASIPDGFRKINAAEGLKSFTLVSCLTTIFLAAKIFSVVSRRARSLNWLL